MKRVNIAFAGWGTGGHVTPIHSLIEYAQQDKDISSHINTYSRFWTQGQLEEKFARTLPDVRFVAISSGKRRRQPGLRSLFLNVVDLGKFLLWVVQSLRLLKKHRIDHVFCKWWYVALPVCLSAWILRIPVSVHESDMHPWLVNSLVSKRAKHLFSWFPNSFKNSTHVGQILSLSLDKKYHQSVDLKNYDPSRKTLLCICWSQWSTAIFNQLIIELDRWWPVVKNANIIVILWILNESMKIKFEKFDNVSTFGFLSSSQLGYLYSLTDFAISRGSATVLAELQMFWTPKLIIPLPHSADQPKNADWYAEKCGDIVLDQDTLSDLWLHVSSLFEKTSDIDMKNISIVYAHGEIWKKIVA